jgi:hypothetical protein
MTNWEHVTIEPEDDQTESAIEYEKLTIGAGGTSLEIIHVEDGRFFVQAVDCDGEIEIGTADDLETAKKLAERWALAQIAEMLKSLGAATWLIRGADSAQLSYTTPEDGAGLAIVLEQPHERILLARFAAGDGEPEGIEYF